MALESNQKIARILGMMVVARPMSMTANMPKKWYVGSCSVDSCWMVIKMRRLAQRAKRYSSARSRESQCCHS